MCGSDETHSYPEISSPTRLSTSGHASYNRAIVYSTWQHSLTLTPTTNSLSTSSNVSLHRTITSNRMAKILIGKDLPKRKIKAKIFPPKNSGVFKYKRSKMAAGMKSKP